MLSALTIRQRGAAEVSLGSGDDETLLRRIRAHANFAEYVPFALLLIAGAVTVGANAYFVHGCGIVLVAGRLLHAKAIYDGTLPLRVAGMVATFAVIVVTSAYIIVRAVI
ncbi:MAG: MAPEG family protein [Alphaproteobacteria bacterium]